MSDWGSGSRRAGSVRARNASRSATSSARSSAAFERDHDQHPQGLSQAYPNRYNPSLRSVGSRFSLSDQFATTRREYEFEFDDGASFMTADAEVETGQDDSLTAAGSLGDVVDTPPASPRGAPRGAGGGTRQSGPERVRRSHYEILALSRADEVSKRDICRAYFRLCDILRSDGIPAQYRDLAERYLGHAQAAFEALSGRHSRDDYDASSRDEELEEGASSGGEDEDDSDGNMRHARRTDPRLVRALRRQQQASLADVSVHMDARPLHAPGLGPLHARRGGQRTLSVTHTTIFDVPAARQVLQPRLHQVRGKLSGGARAAGAGHGRSELYCTAPTVAASATMFATNAWDPSHVPPASAAARQLARHSDILPRDRQLRWLPFSLFAGASLKLRQELFLREAGLPDAALRRTLPDAVLEVETDAASAASLTARASHVLRLPGRGGRPAEPLHTEASVSVNRAWPGAGLRPRLGLGVHRRVGGRHGGTAFACADSGTPAASPGQPLSGPREGGSAGSWWLGYMDQLAQLPGFFSPPTLEVGYKSGRLSEDTLGLRSGRAFTRPAGSGLQRLDDGVGVGGPDRGGSWTMSGAITTGGVAGYLRFGRNLLSSPNGLEQSLIPSRLKGVRFEAELSAYTPTPNSLLGRMRSVGRPEISRLAVRGLKNVGKSSRAGLELSVASGGGSVVLSLYHARKNRESLTIPLLLFRDEPSPHRFFTAVLLLAGFVPALALAVLDHARAFLARSDARSEEDKSRRPLDVQRFIAARRAEADDLVTLLAEPVTRRQHAQRERRGLVILSAKYGVLLAARPPSPTPGEAAPAAGPAIHLGPSWASPDEVADVTVALAALVEDDGTLCIPGGLRKSRLLGFWDPSPTRTKCLFVRYVFRGQERVREVMGRDELVLP